MEAGLLTKEKGLTGNQLKLIAAVSMLLDHAVLLTLGIICPIITVTAK